jgi:hypothetical protein
MLMRVLFIIGVVVARAEGWARGMSGDPADNNGQP